MGTAVYVGWSLTSLSAAQEKGEHGGLKTIWRGEALAEKRKLSEGRNYAFSTSGALGGCSSAELVRAELNGPDRKGMGSCPGVRVAGRARTR